MMIFHLSDAQQTRLAKKLNRQEKKKNTPIAQLFKSSQKNGFLFFATLSLFPYSDACVVD
jgi:hypothetical protein